MLVIGLALPVLALVSAALLALEVRRFKAGRHFISPRRLGLRLVAGGLMIVLLAAVFVGLFVLKLLEAASRPQLFLTYWSACLVSAVVLMLVMLADLREVANRSLKRKHELWRDMAQFVAKSGGRRESGESESPEDGAKE